MGFKFEQLLVYQKAVGLADKIYSFSKNFPRDEIYGLTSQLRRAAVSISLNIAEGSARTKKDFRRFVDMARGSVFECVTVLKISVNQKYITQPEFDELTSDSEEISKMLSGLKRGLN